MKDLLDFSLAELTLSAATAEVTGVVTGTSVVTEELGLVDGLRSTLVDKEVRVGRDGTLREVAVAGLHVRTGEVAASDCIIVDSPGVVTSILLRLEGDLVGEGEVLQRRVVHLQHVTTLERNLVIRQSELTAAEAALVLF